MDYNQIHFSVLQTGEIYNNERQIIDCNILSVLSGQSVGSSNIENTEKNNEILISFYLDNGQPLFINKNNFEYFKENLINSNNYLFISKNPLTYIIQEIRKDLNIKKHENIDIWFIENDEKALSIVTEIKDFFNNFLNKCDFIDLNEFDLNSIEYKILREIFNSYNIKPIKFQYSYYIDYEIIYDVDFDLYKNYIFFFKNDIFNKNWILNTAINTIINDGNIPLIMLTYKYQDYTGSFEQFKELFQLAYNKTLFERGSIYLPSNIDFFESNNLVYMYVKIDSFMTYELLNKKLLSRVENTHNIKQINYPPVDGIPIFKEINNKLEVAIIFRNSRILNYKIFELNKNKKQLIDDITQKWNDGLLLSEWAKSYNYNFGIISDNYLVYE